jgi:hypothetical protein
MNQLRHDQPPTHSASVSTVSKTSGDAMSSKEKSWTLSGVLMLGYAFVAGWLLSTVGPLFVQVIGSNVIIGQAEASATLISVVVTGFFGFGGMMLTNALSAHADRVQSDRNEKMAMKLQAEMGAGLERRIQDFSDAFAKYHAETLMALNGTRSPSDDGVCAHRSRTTRCGLHSRCCCSHEDRKWTETWSSSRR